MRNKRYAAAVRTTVDLDDDVAAEIQRRRREAGRGLSETVNDLIRRGMSAREDRAPYVPTTRRLGIRIDVSNVAEALDYIEGHAAR